MTKPKDPADSTPKPTDPAGPAVDEAPTSPVELQNMIEIIATAAAQSQGLRGSQLKEQVRELVTQVQGVAKEVELAMAVDESRKHTVSEIQRLIDVMMQAGQNTAKVIGPHRDAIARMFRHVDFEKMSMGLRLVHEYLQNPNAVTEDRIKELMGDLEATMGPLVNFDPTREDERRREEIKKDVQSQLEKIFRNTSFAPDVSNLAPPIDNDAPPKKKPE